MEAKGAGEMHLSASGAEAASRTRARCNHHPLSVEAFCHRFDVAKRAPSGLPNFVPVVCAPNERAAGHSLASIAASHTQPPLAAPQRRRCRLSASPPPSLPCVASSNISTTFTTSFIAASVAAPQQPPPPPDPPPPCPFQYHPPDLRLRLFIAAFFAASSFAAAFLAACSIAASSPSSPLASSSCVPSFHRRCRAAACLDGAPGWPAPIYAACARAVPARCARASCLLTSLGGRLCRMLREVVFALLARPLWAAVRIDYLNANRIVG